MAKISALPLAGPLDGTESVPISLGNTTTKRTLVSTLLAGVAALLPAFYKGDKGDPGGVLDAIGTFQQARAGLFNVPAGVSRVRTTGNVQKDVGSGWYDEAGSFAEAKVNLLASPADFTSASWTLGNGATAVADTGGYSILSDTSATAYSSVGQPVALPPGGQVTFEQAFRKDAVPASTRTAMLQASIAGGAACAVQLDTSTGAFVAIAGGPYVAPDDAGVVDQGDSWLLFLTVTFPVAGALSFLIFPAWSHGLGSSDYAVTGSVAAKAPSAYAGNVRASLFDALHVDTSFAVLDGRRFKLSLDQWITTYQFGFLDGAADNAPALTKFFVFIGANRCRWVDPSCAGTVLSTVTANAGLSKHWRGMMRLTAGAPMTAVLVMNGFSFAMLSGFKLELYGTGGQAYASRGVMHGLVVNNCGRMRLGGVEGANFKYAVVHSPSAGSGNNNNNADFGLVKGNYAGSGSKTISITESLTANWTAAAGATSGTTDSLNQGTTFSVDEIPELAITDGMGVDTQVRMHPQNRPYMVKAITRAVGNDGSGVGPGMITVFPPFDASATAAGTLEWLHGGCFSNSGANSNFQTVEVDATQCGRALALDSLFSGNILVSSQFCGTVVAAGERLSGAHDTTKIELGYCEGNSERSVIANSWQGAGGHIHFMSMVGSQDDYTELDWTFSPVHSFTTFQSSDGKAGMRGSILPYRHRILSFQKNDPAAYRKLTDTLQLDPNDNQPWIEETGLNTRLINVMAINPSMRRNLGVSGLRYVIRGTGPNGAPTSITATASDGLSSGASSVVFSGFDGPALLSSEYDQATGGQDIRVIAGKGPPMVPFVYAGETLAAGAIGAVTTVTLTGAALGDALDAAYLADQAGVRLDAWIASANTVKFRFSNPTGAAITLAAGTVNLRTRKA